MERLFSLGKVEGESRGRCIWVNGAVIVGAGPSGLATAACLKEEGVPFVVVERADCIASLWKNRTYDRLKLHLPKQFCQLPKMPFPDHYPQYPTRNQFIEYLHNYANHFGITPRFNESVHSARYDDIIGMWRVTTASHVEYICRWLVVATGENAERVLPDIHGLGEFQGEVIHAGDYKSGEKFAGKRVLVVGCGNSGMELALDLSNHRAEPSVVVRSSLHVLPREVMGRSTFELAVMMLRWLPLWVVDKVMLMMAWFVLGNVESYGLKRPTVGPLELKNTKGKTPVLDIGTFSRIKSGHITVVPGIKRFFSNGLVQLVNGQTLPFDAVVLATGYRSNVPSWLQEGELFSKNGYPKMPFPHGWKGEAGLYAVGFTKRGLSGASSDAIKTALDIATIWKQETKQQNKQTRTLTACHRRCISHF